jgi:hypothetical protein
MFRDGEQMERGGFFDTPIDCAAGSAPRTRSVPPCPPTWRRASSSIAVAWEQTRLGEALVHRSAAYRFLSPEHNISAGTSFGRTDCNQTALSHVLVKVG